MDEEGGTNHVKRYRNATYNDPFNFETEGFKRCGL